MISLIVPLLFAWTSQAPAAAPPIELREAIVLPSTGRGGRTSVRIDPVAALVASGKWVAPKSGDKLTVGGQPGPEWKTLKAGDDGTFRDAALQGGYASVNVPSNADRILILEATGHDMVYESGSPRAGDPYGHGYVHLPVFLHQGDNNFLFSVGRGSLKARLTVPKASTYFDLADATLPELVAGSPVSTWAGIVVINASNKASYGMTIVATLDGQATESKIPAIPALSARKVAVKLVGPAPSAGEPHELRLSLKNGATNFDETTIKLAVRKPEETRNVTFVSEIDGSVQYYGFVPAKPDLTNASRKPGLILTLHGAGVEGAGQARVYAPKSGLHVIAPTNRRAFGFDWEDWGRLDALEVLGIAEKSLDTDPHRTYLTGHSMGGHGTWHLGVTYPGRFAAIAPSAGWVSMFSYAGMKKTQNPSPIDEILQRSSTGSDTLVLAPNLKGLGVYVLHGDADDNVPVSQARDMRKVLSEFHTDFTYYERIGAGHWWGNECCDWPPLIDFLTRHERATETTNVDFVTASPGISTTRDWATIEAQSKAMVPSTIHLKHDPNTKELTGTTENVSRLSLALPSDSLKVTLDKSPAISLDRKKGSTTFTLVHEGDIWKEAGELSSSAKTPPRCGPFKAAFRNRMIFVYGTKGTPEENAWAVAKARYDAETFAYRGNGSIDVIPDSEFDPKSDPDRNVIVYGNADSNAAWEPLLKASPVTIHRGIVQIGDREMKGKDLACLFVQPRPDSATASVGVVSGTGPIGMRATDRLSYFSSGVAFPDFFVMSADALENGTSGVRCAGFFGPDWGLEGAEIK